MTHLPTPIAESDLEHTCAGLPYLGVRGMTPEERTTLAELRRRDLRDGWTSLALIAVILALPFAVAGWRVPDPGPVLGIIAALVVVPGFFIAIAVLGLRARDRWRSRARLGRDLSDGRVLEFAGVFPRHRAALPDQRVLADAGVVELDSTKEQRIAVLAGTHHILHRDARGRWRLVPARVRAAAATPAYAMRVGVPAEIAFAADPAKELVRRSLSAAEREELGSYVRQIRWRLASVLFLVPLAIVGVTMLLAWLRSPEHSLLGAVGPLLAFGFLAHAARRFAGAFGRAAALSRDRAIGWVFTVQRRMAPSPASSAEDRDDEGSDPSASGEEFLPISRVVWTQGGHPAAWRNVTI